MKDQFGAKPVSLSHQYQPGQTIGGRYQVVSCIGRGGMGVVYHVNQIFINKDLALKTIETHDTSELSTKRFQHEARTAFAVQHPNVVSVTDFGLLDDQTPFLVMELVQGETLAERLKRKGTLSPKDAVIVFRQICAGLQHAHDFGIVHRDIKPSNIMLRDDVDLNTQGSVKILDFGIAKLAEDTNLESGFTHSGEIFGSPLYMSPEQCSGSRIDKRSDIYSLGCMLFETLTGTPPFIGESALTTMNKQKTARIPTLQEASLGKEFPQALEEIVHTMLEKSPERRYQNLKSVIQDLTATMRGEVPTRAYVPVSANEASEEKTGRLSLQRPVFFGAIFLTILSSATLAGFAAFTAKHEQKVEQKAFSTQQVSHQKVEMKAMALDEDTVDQVQMLTPQQVSEKLRKPEPGGRVIFHFKTIPRHAFLTLGNTPWIRDLDLESSTFNNADLGELAKIPNLDILNVRGTTIDEQGAEMLSNCKNLQVFSAGGNELTDKAMASVSKIKAITTLDLNSTRVTDHCYQSFKTLPHLESLELGECDVTGHGISALSSCRLNRLDVHNSKLDDQGLAEIAELPKLNTLRLKTTNISPKGLLGLIEKDRHKKSIHDIYISKCPNVNPLDLASIKLKAPWIVFHTETEKPTVEHGV